MWLTPRVLFSKTKADMHLFPDAENRVNIYIVYQYFNFLTFSALSPHQLAKRQLLTVFQ